MTLPPKLNSAGAASIEKNGSLSMTTGLYPMSHQVSKGEESLEQSYRTRRREKAIQLLMRVAQKSLREYSFSSSRKSDHLQKAFVRWKAYSVEIRAMIKGKEKFITQWF